MSGDRWPEGWPVSKLCVCGRRPVGDTGRCVDHNRRCERCQRLLEGQLLCLYCSKRGTLQVTGRRNWGDLSTGD